MKLSSLYEEMLEGLHFHEVNDGGRLILLLMDGKSSIGYINIDLITNGYEMFEEFMSEDEYLKLFRGDSFYEIEHLEVDKKHVDGGFGTKLIKKAIETIKSKGGKAIYLNASPVKHESLDLDTLVNFYSKFGFKVIPDTEDEYDNKEMILRL